MERHQKRGQVYGPVASYGCVESVAVIHDIASPLGILLETEVRA